MKTANTEADQSLQTLETQLGEALVFRTTGRLLAVEGLDEVPVNSWGLVALTATRVVFHHFPNSHPLMTKKDAEVRWSAERSRFDTCTLHVAKFWEKILSSVPDHLVLAGPGVRMAVEVADFPKNFLAAWTAT